jgi:hypothetical protein
VHTRELLVEEGGFVYDADAYNDDLPYFTTVKGTRHLVVPYSLTYNDARFVLAQGYSSPTDFADSLKRAFDTYWDEGAERPRMMSIGLHPRLIGQAARIAGLKDFLDYALDKGDVWFATRIDIAHWWLEHHEEFTVAGWGRRGDRGVCDKEGVAVTAHAGRGAYGTMGLLQALSPRAGVGTIRTPALGKTMVDGPHRSCFGPVRRACSPGVYTVGEARSHCAPSSITCWRTSSCLFSTRVSRPTSSSVPPARATGARTPSTRSCTSGPPLIPTGRPSSITASA